MRWRQYWPVHHLQALSTPRNVMTSRLPVAEATQTMIGKLPGAVKAAVTALQVHHDDPSVLCDGLRVIRALTEGHGAFEACGRTTSTTFSLKCAPRLAVLCRAKSAARCCRSREHGRHSYGTTEVCEGRRAHDSGRGGVASAVRQRYDVRSPCVRGPITCGSSACAVPWVWVRRS